MKTLACIAFAVAALALSASATFAQDSLENRPTILVTGAGRAEAQPDQFKVSLTVEGRGSNQVEALRALAAAQTRMIETLPDLAGLMWGKVTTGEIVVEPTFDPSCGTGEYERDTSDCPIVGYSVASPVSLTGSPAERAGDAISLASELGATRARLDDYSLSDMRALQDAANRLAFADAERQARMLSEASGRQIVRILRIQDPSSRVIDTDENPAEVEDVIVTGSRIRSAAVSIAVAPEPVIASARVTVLFEIE